MLAWHVACFELFAALVQTLNSAAQQKLFENARYFKRYVFKTWHDIGLDVTSDDIVSEDRCTEDGRLGVSSILISPGAQ